ncbi:MAG TPA: response regulator transcription factor [Chthoniobacteraceae bacterium]|jgi:DNA-binding NarL/FixJ family response regulator
MRKKTTVLVVDDHELIRRGVRHLLEAHPDFEICGEVGDGRAAVELARTLRPDVAVVDMCMPGLNGFEATRQLRRAVPSLEVVAISGNQSVQFVDQAIGAGARGYVSKNAPGGVLLSAVEAAREHRPFFDPEVSLAGYAALQRLAPAAAKRPTSELTRRERETLQLLAEGMSNKEVARTMSISVKTVETHRARIMAKLQVNSIADLVRYAIRNNIAQA